MRVSKKVKLLALAGLVSLASCTTAQLQQLTDSQPAGDYSWLAAYDAQTSVADKKQNVLDSAKEALKTNLFTIDSTDTTGNKSEIVATNLGTTVRVVVEDIGSDRSTIYIKDTAGADQAELLMEQITTNTKHY